jgi:hypothetical protein
MSFVVMDSDPNKRVELAIEDIRAGRMVILIDDEDRENEGDLTMAASMVTPEAINFMATHGRGLICLTLTEERVEQLSLPMMATHNKSPYETAFTVSIEARTPSRWPSIPAWDTPTLWCPDTYFRFGRETVERLCAPDRPKALWTWRGSPGCIHRV